MGLVDGRMKEFSKTACICSGLLGRLDGKPRGFPFRETILQPQRTEAFGTQDGHGLDSVNTIRSAAIGDDLGILRQFAEPPVELGKGNVPGTGKMSLHELVLRSYIEHGDEARGQALRQSLAGYRLHRVS